MATDSPTKKGLSLKKMVNDSLIIDLNNGKDVHVLSTKFTVSAKGRKAVIGTCQSPPKKNGTASEKYKCSIIGLEDEGPLSAQKCMVSCPCERFTYYFEVALAKKGASKIKYSNGDMPVVTNPHMITGLCKHLIALSKDLMKKKL
jgi:hypothetical protein